MSNLYSIAIDNNLVSVSGELSYATVNDVLQETDALFDPIATLNINLADVTRSDSAGVALLVHWMRQAKNDSKKLVLQNIPTQMLAIAESSGLDELFPVE